MKKYIAGIVLSLAALLLAGANLIIRIVYKLDTSSAALLLCVVAVIFCGCLVGYVTNKNKE